VRWLEGLARFNFRTMLLWSFYPESIGSLNWHTWLHRISFLWIGARTLRALREILVRELSMDLTLKTDSLQDASMMCCSFRAALWSWAHPLKWSSDLQTDRVTANFVEPIDHALFMIGPKGLPAISFAFKKIKFTQHLRASVHERRFCQWWSRDKKHRWAASSRRLAVFVLTALGRKGDH
jgi:hypothetical protein